VPTLAWWAAGAVLPPGLVRMCLLGDLGSQYEEEEVPPVVWSRTVVWPRDAVIACATSTARKGSSSSVSGAYA
jgi:hypothetical protein